MKEKNKFPHNPLFYTASLFHWFTSKLFSLMLFVFLISLYVINLNAPKKAVFVPLNTSQHIFLARSYWEQGNETRAKQELSFVQPNVLGAETNGVLTSWKAEKEKLQRDQAYWNSIVVSYPQYRDAYMRLAILANKLGDTDTAKAYMLEAKKLDPNNELITHYLTSVDFSSEDD